MSCHTPRKMHPTLLDLFCRGRESGVDSDHKLVYVWLSLDINFVVESSSCSQ